MDKKRVFDKIVKDIKSIKIQGAKNIAKKALYAYSLFPNRESKKILLSLRPTEPMLKHVLSLVGKKRYNEITKHFDESQDKINKNVFSLISKNDKIFTHCHSTNVVNSLIYSYSKGKKFEVFNTETRPLFQGRKTAKELKKAGIKVTMFVDSAFASILEKDNSKDKTYTKKIFLGADALLNEGIINKVGSKTISELAYYHKIPVYIIADSWKYTSEKILLENRQPSEIWNKSPKGIKIKNPAFEFVPKKFIHKIVTEYGVLSYEDFLKIVKKKSFN
jgi:translation initiation factor 2B subunit (eIF-2B alpha/beta/delta family)